MMKRQFNADELLSMDPRRAGKAAMHVANAVQNLPIEDQVAGVALTFELLLRKFKQRPTDILVGVRNMLDRARGRRPELKAIESFVQFDMNPDGETISL